MKPLFFISLCLWASSLVGCAFDHKKDLGDSSKTASGAVKILDRPIGYAEVAQAVLGPRCVNCHGQGGGNQGGINLETFEAVSPLVLRIEQATLKDKTMPKGAALSDSEAQILATWIAQGASRNGSIGQSPKLKESPTWAVIHDEIFQKKCLDCHSGPRPDKGLDLSTLEITKANISKIFDLSVVEQDPAKLMPESPFEPLTFEEKQALAQWIAIGMPE